MGAEQFAAENEVIRVVIGRATDNVDGAVPSNLTLSGPVVEMLKVSVLRLPAVISAELMV